MKKRKYTDENTGKFKPGNPGGGRPKGSGLNLTSLLKAKLEEIPEGQKIPYKEMFTKTILHKALVEKDLQSLKLVMNYVDGLPQQKLDLTSGGERITMATFLTELNEDNEETTE